MLLALILGAAGCGGGDDDSDSDNTTSAPAATAPGEGSAARQAKVDKISSCLERAGLTIKSVPQPPANSSGITFALKSGNNAFVYVFASPSAAKEGSVPIGAFTKGAGGTTALIGDSVVAYSKPAKGQDSKQIENCL